MRPRSRFGVGLLGLTLATCTDGGGPLVAYAPHEVLAQVLHLQLPPSAGPEALAEGPTVFVTPTEIAVTHLDRSLVRHLEPRPLERGESLLDPLYGAIASEVSTTAPVPINVLIGRAHPSVDPC